MKMTRFTASSRPFATAFHDGIVCGSSLQCETPYRPQYLYLASPWVSPSLTNTGIALLAGTAPAHACICSMTYQPLRRLEGPRRDPASRWRRSPFCASRVIRPAAKGSGYCYLHDPDPAVAKRRSRNASRAATLGNYKIGTEIRSTRLLVRDIVELTISNELHPLVRKRLTEVAQLLQVYARLAELEIAAGEKPRAGNVALPEDTGQRGRQWAQDEESKMQKGKELVEEIGATMSAHGHDPTPIREVLDG